MPAECRTSGRPPAAEASEAYAQAGVGLRGALFASRATFKPLARPVSGPFSIAPTTATSDADIALVKQVIEAANKGNEVEADVAESSIADPVARKLAEWMVLRSYNTQPNFQRYANFVEANPDWPHVPLFRRRAENALWNDKIDDATVRDFFAHRKPTMAKGRYVLARALLAQGDRNGAPRWCGMPGAIRTACSDVEKAVLEQFGGMLTREDHKIRMDQRFYDDDTEAGLRAAERLGGNELAIARAWTAVIKKARNAKALLDAVPAAARNDAGYIFARAQWLRKHDKLEEAAHLHPDRAERRRRPRRRQSMVAGAPHPDPRSARQERRPDRLPAGARCRHADARQLPRRQAFHRRLDRAALPARSQDRRRAFRPDQRGHQ